MNRLTLCLALATMFCGMAASVTRADDDCACAHCGCCCSCQKVCRLVEEEKKVEIVCWGKKCEEVLALVTRGEEPPRP